MPCGVLVVTVATPAAQVIVAIGRGGTMCGVRSDIVVIRLSVLGA